MKKTCAFVPSMVSAVIAVLCHSAVSTAAQEQKPQGAIARLGTWLTSDLRAAASKFTSAAESDRELAYAGVSRAFQYWVTATQFQEFLSAHDFKPATVKWTKHTMKASTSRDAIGEVEGTLTTKGGTLQPLRVTFLKQDGTWRLHGISAPNPRGLANGMIPSEDALVRLTNASMNAFGRSVNANSMEALFQYAAVQFRAQRSIEQLDKAFDGFLNKGIVLPDFMRLTPVFSESPTLDKNGDLVLKGYYLQRSKNYYDFTHSYVLEGIGWKLINASSKIDTSGNEAERVRAKLPAEEVYVHLAKSTMEDFAASVLSGNMVGLYDSMSVLAKTQLSPDNLKASFASFSGKTEALELVKHAKPMIDRPSLTPAGTMLVIGHYPGPQPVGFKLQYEREGLVSVSGGWKLTGISVVIGADAIQKIRE